MALFGLKKKSEKVAATEVVKTKAVKESGDNGNTRQTQASTVFPDVLIRPRITEKATDLSGDNVYTFNVRKDATAREVVAAVFEVYKVAPRQVNFAAIPVKKMARRGKIGSRGGGKKAYVYLKPGDKIEFV